MNQTDTTMLAVELGQNGKSVLKFVASDSGDEQSTEEGQCPMQDNAVGGKDTAADATNDNGNNDEDMNGTVELNMEKPSTSRKDVKKIITLAQLKHLHLMLKQWINEVEMCEQAAFDLFCIMEEKVGAEVAKREAADADNAAPINGQDEVPEDALIYGTMRQLFEYYDNIQLDDGSPTSSRDVSPCTYWDGFTQDVMIHSGEGNEGNSAGTYLCRLYYKSDVNFQNK